MNGLTILQTHVFVSGSSLSLMLAASKCELGIGAADCGGERTHFNNDCTSTSDQEDVVLPGRDAKNK
jgi:hypothetical protein